jgi:ribosomal protein L11 methyltransferase
VCDSPADIEGEFDVVVANILAGPLVQFAESITSTLASRGMLALSGVLCEQAAAVMAAYAPWIEFQEPVYREQDGQMWSRLTGKRR